ILTTLCVVGILSCASADLGKLEATTAELLTPETQDYGTTASDYNDKETTDYFTTASGSDLTTSGQDEEWATPVTVSGEDEFTVTAPDYLENYSEIADESLNEVDVNITVDKVEEILASNPNLPRLSRAEILEILDNITNDEQNANEYDTTELRAGESATENANYIKLPSRDDFKTREDYMRALMVVLPYSAKNLSDTRIQELYTKPPITWLLTNTTDELSYFNFKPLPDIDQIKDAPDPLSFEELLQINDVEKNEVKRQQDNNTASGSASSSSNSSSSDSSLGSSSSSSSSSSSNSTEGPSFADLADSFGGGETASEDADVIKNLPTPKPNGLYFLLDWHSFLEVGEEDKNKVNIRLEPQAGNSRNFLSVEVP
ncbi:unnamed protein product, partial [Timema podura]|nr:unnamed protein product [Timema podura]